MWPCCRDVWRVAGRPACRKLPAICGNSLEFWHMEASAWQTSDGCQDRKTSAGEETRAILAGRDICDRLFRLLGYPAVQQDARVASLCCCKFAAAQVPVGGQSRR